MNRQQDRAYAALPEAEGAQNGGSQDAREVTLEKKGEGVTEQGFLSSRVGVVCLCSVVILAAGILAFMKLRQSTPDQVFARVEDIVDKPKADLRTYTAATLHNGLETLLVQDPHATEFAMAVAVTAGSLYDPNSLPGLAHFCEHMLFLGTEHFPQPMEFDHYLAANGGSANAYTADEVTVYFASVAPEATSGALSRFADFFKYPLFDSKFVGKEVKAIDSEHAKNKQDESRRAMGVMLSLANPESHVGRFSTGDYQTLYEDPKDRGESPVSALRTYYDENYCPPRMRLTLIGPEKPAVLLDRAAEAFGEIKPAGKAQKCAAAPTEFAYPDPWGRAQLGHWVDIRGTTAFTSMWVMFSLPDLRQEFLSHPLDYVDYVLRYSGEGSLLSVLDKQLALADSISCSQDMGSAGTTYWVSFALTEKGRKHPEVVFDVFFEYLGRLQEKGVDMGLYRSIAKVDKLGWDWAPPSTGMNAASDLAERMVRLPRENLLSADGRIDQPDGHLVSNLMSRLEPGNMNVGFIMPAEGEADAKRPSLLEEHTNRQSFLQLVVKKHAIGNATAAPQQLSLFQSSMRRAAAALSSQQPQEQTLPHYGVKYTVQEAEEKFPGAPARWASYLAAGATDSAGFLRQLQKVDPNLKSAPLAQPPRAIQGVPDSISLAYSKAPELSAGEDHSIAAKLYGPVPLRFGESSLRADGAQSPELWYRQGWKTTSPRFSMRLAFRLLEKEGSPEPSAVESMRLNLFSRMLAKKLQPKMVDLVTPGMSYSIETYPKGVSFSFGGFAALLPNIMDKVLGHFKAGLNASDSALFQREVQEIKQELSSYSEMPISYAIEARNRLLTKGASETREEALAALREVTAADAYVAKDQVLGKPLLLTSLTMGNLPQAQAESLVGKFSTELDYIQGGPKDGSVEISATILSPGKPIELRSPNPRAGDPNDVTIVSLVAGPATVESRVVFALLGRILQPLAFSELRTKKQLGYVVNAGVVSLSNVQLMSTVVQGDQLRADDVEPEIERVLSVVIPERLATMEAEEFASLKESFRQELSAPPQSEDGEFAHFWSPTAMNGQCFYLRDAMLEYLTGLTSKQPLVDAWAKLVMPASDTRQRVAVKYFAGAVPPRPSLEEAQAAWAKAGVPDQILALGGREHSAALLFDKSTADSRKRILEEGGSLFSKEMGCKLGAKPAANFVEKAALAKDAALQRAPASFLQASVVSALRHPRENHRPVALLQADP